MDVKGGRVNVVYDAADAQRTDLLMAIIPALEGAGYQIESSEEDR